MFVAGTSAEDPWATILLSDVQMLVTLFHFTVDNNAEPVVTKRLEYALDVQCAVVTCYLLPIISLFRSLPIATALGKKRNLWKQNSVYNRRVRSRILSHVKKSETRDCRGNCLVARTLQNRVRVLYNEQSPLHQENYALSLTSSFLTFIHSFIHLLSNVVLSYSSFSGLPKFSITFFFLHLLHSFSFNHNFQKFSLSCLSHSLFLS
jgi:hypothetical protein